MQTFVLLFTPDTLSSNWTGIWLCGLTSFKPDERVLLSMPLTIIVGTQLSAFVNNYEKIWFFSSSPFSFFTLKAVNWIETHNTHRDQCAPCCYCWGSGFWGHLHPGSLSVGVDGLNCGISPPVRHRQEYLRAPQSDLNGKKLLVKTQNSPKSWLKLSWLNVCKSKHMPSQMWPGSWKWMSQHKTLW